MVDSDTLMGREELKEIAGDICCELKTWKKAPNHGRIYIVDERE